MAYESSSWDPTAQLSSAPATRSSPWTAPEGLITGMENSTLAPAGYATRAQIATILMRYCEG